MSKHEIFGDLRTDFGNLTLINLNLRASFFYIRTTFRLKNRVTSVYLLQLKNFFSFICAFKGKIYVKLKIYLEASPLISRKSFFLMCLHLSTFVYTCPVTRLYSSSLVCTHSVTRLCFQNRSCLHRFLFYLSIYMLDIPVGITLDQGMKYVQS